MHDKGQCISKKLLTVQTCAEDGIKLAKILFYSASTPILFFDREYNILMCNSGCARLLGFDQSFLTGRPMSTLLNREQLRDFHDLQDTLQGDEQYWRGEFIINQANGSPVNMEITVQRAQLKYQVIYVLYLDRSQLKQGRGDNPGLTHGSSADLDNALRYLQREHDRYQRNLSHHIQVNLLPCLEKLSQAQDERARSNYRDILVRELAGLANGSNLEMDPELIKLTPTEMEVCKYIGSGLSSKEIATMMYSSFDTIQTHRKNIRKKMGLSGRKTSLCTYLRVKKRMSVKQVRI